MGWDNTASTCNRGSNSQLRNYYCSFGSLLTAIRRKKHPADLKPTMGKRVLMVRTKAKLRNAAHEHTVMQKKTPERVMSFCQAPTITYAAD